MKYYLADIIYVKGFRDKCLFEVVGESDYSGLYYVTKDCADSELLLPDSLFELVCRAENREDLV